jgi:hypothetical protein
MQTRILLAVGFLAACASTKATTTPEELLYRPEAPVAKSSIALLLAHRADLNLDDEQVTKLDDLDHKREDSDRMVEQDMRAQIGDQHYSRIRMGNPSMKAMQGRVGRAARESNPRFEPPADNDYIDVAQQRLDENDDHAAAEAEKIMNESQLPLAKTLLEQYRQDVNKQRQEQIQKRSTAK